MRCILILLLGWISHRVMVVVWGRIFIDVVDVNAARTIIIGIGVGVVVETTLT